MPSLSRDQAMHLAHAAMAVLVALSLIKPAAAAAQGPAGYVPTSPDTTDAAAAAFTSSLYDDGDQVAFWIFVAMFPILGAIAIFVTILMVFLSPKRSSVDAKLEEGKGDDESELDLGAEDAEDAREEDAYGAVPRLDQAEDAPEKTKNKNRNKNKDLPALPLPPPPEPAQFPNGFHDGFSGLPVVSPAPAGRHERHT